MNKQNIYVTGAEQGSGKSIIMLAMMDMLSGYAGKIGFFRPIINDSESKDELIQLIRHRYHIDFPYESMYGCQLEEAQDLINRDKYNELLTRILIKFRTLSAPGAPSYLMKYLGLLSPNIHSHTERIG